APLRFKVVDAAGAVVPLNLYMGMLAHAAVRHVDGTVFAHLHPVGTISMASQQFFAASLEDTNHASSAESHHAPHADAAVIPQDGISFPYEFPKAGRFRIWVQVKSHDRVLTGIFDAEVGDFRR
ncbi:MAG TPA: hypothetical protein VFV83_02675, partial [Chthoniobacteraceae bacterium]|nr:hypothetical protein [Chthoniobacteraceae bacterium]